MTTKEKLLFVSPLILLAVPLLLRAKNSQRELRKVMVQLAGPDAVNCNATHQYGFFASTVKTGKPFFSIDSRQYEPTEHAYFWFGMVRTPEERMFNMCWQESPWYSLT